MTDVDTYLRQDLPRLLEVVQASDVLELELQIDNLNLRLHRSGLVNAERVAEDVAEPDALAPLPPRGIEITSPLVGTFYRAEEPGMPPLVSEGAYVEDQTVVGIVEALQVLTHVQAGCRGTVTKVLATDGQPVGYGQVLFEVSPGD
jgi:acetyl-CoA carboxylase biotin carboxyl carrier protein